MDKGETYHKRTTYAMLPAAVLGICAMFLPARDLIQFRCTHQVANRITTTQAHLYIERDFTALKSHLCTCVLNVNEEDCTSPFPSDLANVIHSTPDISMSYWSIYVEVHATIGNLDHQLFPVVVDELSTYQTVITHLETHSNSINFSTLRLAFPLTPHLTIVVKTLMNAGAIRFRRDHSNTFSESLTAARGQFPRPEATLDNYSFLAVTSTTEKLALPPFAATFIDASGRRVGVWNSNPLLFREFAPIRWAIPGCFTSNELPG